jgi:hypothetical protein
MTTTTTTPLLKAHPPSRRVLTVALAFGAGAALGITGMALTTSDHTSTRAPAAESAAAAAARTVADHGSVSAVDHRDRLALGGDAAARTVADHGSVSAVDHRDEMSARDNDS